MRNLFIINQILFWKLYPSNLIVIYPFIWQTFGKRLKLFQKKNEIAILKLIIKKVRTSIFYLKLNEEIETIRVSFQSNPLNCQKPLPWRRRWSRGREFFFIRHVKRGKFCAYWWPINAKISPPMNSLVSPLELQKCLPEDNTWIQYWI